VSDRPGRDVEAGRESNQRFTELFRLFRPTTAEEYEKIIGLHRMNFSCSVAGLCRSASAGSIPAPACLIEMINSRNTDEDAFVTQLNACVFAAKTAITSAL
jgi:hypothetical protein